MSSEKIEKALHVGDMMANVCFNGKQRDELPDDYRKSMAELQPQWDKVRRDAMLAIQQQSAEIERLEQWKEGAGYHDNRFWWDGDPERRTVEQWRPSTDANAARLVGSRMAELGKASLWAAQVANEVNAEFVSGTASWNYYMLMASPRQLCTAALIVLDQQEAT